MAKEIAQNVRNCAAISLVCGLGTSVEQPYPTSLKLLKIRTRPLTNGISIPRVLNISVNSSWYFVAAAFCWKLLNMFRALIVRNHCAVGIQSRGKGGSLEPGCQALLVCHVLFLRKFQKVWKFPQKMIANVGSFLQEWREETKNGEIFRVFPGTSAGCQALNFFLIHWQCFTGKTCNCKHTSYTFYTTIPENVVVKLPKHSHTV